MIKALIARGFGFGCGIEFIVTAGLSMPEIPAVEWGVTNRNSFGDLTTRNAYSGVTRRNTYSGAYHVTPTRTHDN